MGGDEDGDALIRHGVDEIPELPTAEGVDSAGRFIEKDNRRLMQDGAGQCQTLFPATAENSSQTGSMFLQPGHGHRPVEAIFKALAAQAIDAAVKTDIFLDGEIFVEGKFLAHIADMQFDLLGFSTGCHSLPPFLCRNWG